MNTKTTHVWLLTSGSGEDGDEWYVISIHATEEGARKAKEDWEGEASFRRGDVEQWELKE